MLLFKRQCSVYLSARFAMTRAELVLPVSRSHVTAKSGLFLPNLSYLHVSKRGGVRSNQLVNYDRWRWTRWAELLAQAGWRAWQGQGQGGRGKYDMRKMLKNQRLNTGNENICSQSMSHDQFMHP
jgi:hypothetical protein